MARRTNGFINIASPRGPAKKKINKHPPILIKIPNPFAILPTTVTMVSTILIKTSNIAEVNFAMAYKIFPAIFFNIFIYYKTPLFL